MSEIQGTIFLVPLIGSGKNIENQEVVSYDMCKRTSEVIKALGLFHVKAQEVQ